jgi:amidase
MAADRTLIDLTATEAVALLRAGRVSPAELVAASAARIAAVEPAINALPILCLDRARAQAGRIGAGEGPGWLAGLPVSVKDLDEVAGVRHTMGGSVLFEDVVSTESSPMVWILEANGGIPVAKSNSPEFGFNASTINALHGPTRNPYDTRLTVGGSSGGAAASVATGEVWLATGSDLGSSIRLPAAFCGVAGLRPSPGRIPRARRGMPFSTLPVLGPIARTVADVALGMEAMAGESWSDPLSFASRPGLFTGAVAAPVAPTRVAWSPDLGVTPVDPEVAALCAAAVARFAEAGAVVEEACPDFSQAVEVFHAIRGVNHLAAFDPLVAQHGERVIPEIHESLARARRVPIERFAWAERERAAMFGRLMDFFETHDVLVCPAAVMKPFPAEWRRVDQLGNHRFDSYIDWIAITFAISLLGVPVLSLPVGFTADGLPVGVQIIGRPRADAAVLAAGAVLEGIIGAPGRRPVDPVIRPAAA